ncbi:hypothetical protein M758_3G263100 [Ceratodon purpureus]|uniref:Uncharacterized protein n=1 Tax=Ceratodon purpureus TaxID=3225 RepID=A0A8T0IRA3_CERPU|nr:hypothetical protein KC19_3G262600 [Ceratodon purpureus]KAG0624640.1 hypothetical protein M758_3G263100 [Ceratodon purpureus]
MMTGSLHGNTVSPLLSKHVLGCCVRRGRRGIREGELQPWKLAVGEGARSIMAGDDARSSCQVVVVGDHGTGKSSLIIALTTDSFYVPIVFCRLHMKLRYKFRRP